MSLEHPELTALGYRCLLRLPVQWGDQDAFGHVNNTIPIRWFESSRIVYLEQTGMQDLLGQLRLGPILAAINCNYRRQLRYPDTVWVGGKVTRLGNSSLTMVHAVWSEREKAVAAEGDSTIVVFDYAANRPRRVPDEIRAALTAYEGLPPA